MDAKWIFAVNRNEESVSDARLKPTVHRVIYSITKIARIPRHSTYSEELYAIKSRFDIPACSV